MFSFVTDLWEILIACDYINQFIKCTEACNYVVEEIIRPGNPAEHSSDFQNPFESCLRAHEWLIAWALITQLASGNNEQAFSVATIYHSLMKLYWCFDVYNTVVSILLATDQPAYSSGWFCIIKLSQYLTNYTGTKDHCEWVCSSQTLFTVMR